MDSEISELICSTTLVLLGIFDFFRERQHNRFSSLSLVYWMFCLFFGLGPWAAFYYGGWQLSEFEEVPLMEAYLSIGLFLMGLAFVRRNFANGNFLEKLFVRTANLSSQFVLSIYIIILSIRFWVAYKYGLLFDAENDQRVLDLPYLIVVMRSLGNTLSFGCIFWSSISFWSSPKKGRIPILILLTELMYMALQGRREMLFLVLIFGVGFLGSGYKLDRKYVWGLLGVFLGLNLFLFPFFIQIRSVYRASSGNNSFQELAEAFSQWELEKSTSENYYKHNMSERPLIIRFNCRIFEAEEDHDWMFGNAFLRTFVWVLPSFFFPDKHSMKPAEQLIEEHFNLPIHDTSSNWPAYGCADFGLPGSLVVGCLLGVVLLFFEESSNWFLDRWNFMAFCAYGSALKIAMEVEAEPTESWVYLRNILIFFIAIIILRSFFLKRKIRRIAVR